MRRLLRSFTISISAALLLSSPSPALSELSRLNSEGAGALSAGKYSLAALKYGRALKVDSSSIEARAGLSETVRRATALIKSNPEEAMVVFHRAIFLASDHRAGEHLEAAIRATGANPNSADDRLNLARHARGNGDFEGAIVEYISALSINDLPHLRIELADTLRSGNLIGPAMEQYKAAVSNPLLDAPNKVKAWMGLGQCLEARQERTAAEDAFRKAAAANREWRNRLDATPTPASAKAAWEAQRDRHINEGVDLHLAKQFDEAIAEYRLALKMDPKNADILANIGASLHQKGDNEKAKQFYQQALQNSPNHSTALEGMKRLATGPQDPSQLFKAGKFQEAFQYYTELAQKDPTNADAHFNVGATAQALSKVDEAIAAYRLACSLAPTNKEYAAALAKVQHDKADALVDEATKKHKEGDLAEAVKLYQQALLLVPKDPKILYNLAGAYYARQQYPEAERAFEKLIATGSVTRPDAYWFLGQLKENENDGASALTSYREYLDKAPADSFSSAAKERIAALEKDSGNTVKLRTTHEIGKLEPADRAYNQGVELQKQSRFAEAIDAYKRALRMVPGESDYWFALATCSQAAGNLDDAIAAYAKSVEITPKAEFQKALKEAKRLKATPLIESALRNQISGTKSGLEASITEWQKALSIDENPTARLNLGKAYQRLGRNSEALSCYQQALSDDQNSADSHFFMGTIYETMKQPRTALAHYREYLKLSPAGDSVQICRQRVKALEK